ncbi:Uncharacterised protein [Legionella wadsworthii]|uniref:Uncharacterized protein n=1 Tax=Legionella wadsworthii TaxID=28088 RepID=A0A378LX36_9GAMM|nr:hypothetical protein [Legionella wadsworthii]STY28621.1 Uncharacterised protein [Legionella wadsworthii]
MNHDKVANPIKFYKHPDEVKKDNSLSTTDKIKLLENWLDDIKLKLIAEDESMYSTQSRPKYFVAEIQKLLEENTK